MNARRICARRTTRGQIDIQFGLVFRVTRASCRFFRAVDAFEMKIFCVREIYEERKKRGQKNKQTKQARDLIVKGDSGCVMMIFFGVCVCETTNNKRVKT